MAVNVAAYCTRMDVMSATDIALSSPDLIRHVDSAIEGAVGDIDGLTKRRFWNAIETNKWDWPNFQRAYPWRIWFDAAELADVTTTVPTVTTGGDVIPAANLFWGPWNYAPPYSFVEINRSTSSSFGHGSTPQQDVHVTGNFGYWTQSRDGGTLASAVSSTTATTITVSDSSLASVGDVLYIEGESMLVRDWAMADTGQAQQGTGCSTDSTADDVLAVSSGAAIHAGEILQLDAEWMLALSVTGNNVMVQRAWGGTVLATHTGAEVFAMRQYTVARGFGGTTAATHAQNTAVAVALIPAEVHELAVAESLNYVYQKTSGYARTIGEGQALVPGGSLPDLRNRVEQRYGRRARTRVV